MHVKIYGILLLFLLFMQNYGKVYMDDKELIKKTPGEKKGQHSSIPEEITRIKKKAKKIYKNKKGFWEAEFENGIVMVYIPAGEFTMGSNEGLANEKPVHKVYLDDFWLGKFPVTVGQFKKFIKETGYKTDAEKGQGSWQFWKEAWVVRLDGNWKNTYFKQTDDHPVVSVSWNDAMEFCNWISLKGKVNFLLPSEAQWEKGARGIDERMYPWGNEKADGTRANYADVNFWNKYRNARPADKGINDGYTETSPVGSYPAGQSPYGLFDMAGNVWEWCFDYLDENYYAESPKRNPQGPCVPPEKKRPDAERVNRGGGSWTDRSGFITPKGGHNLRSAARTGDEQNSSDDHMGFRLCIKPTDELPDLKNVKIITRHVAGNIYMLETTGDVAGNIGASIGPDGILIVDTQFAPLGSKILNALKKISGEKIKFIINSHSHDDHTHGNKILGKSAVICAHKNTRNRLLKNAPTSSLPVITFDEQLSIHFNGEEIKVVHYPHGHTDSDVVVFFTGSKVVHMGDLFNSGNWSFPIVDLHTGGSIEGFLCNVEKLVQVIPEDVKIIPGHYEIANLKGLKITYDMLKETINIVRSKIEAGLSLKQIKKEGFPAKYDSWGRGYTKADEWIENIYYGLKKNY